MHAYTHGVRQVRQIVKEDLTVMKPSSNAAALSATDELDALTEHIRALLTRIDRLEQQHKQRKVVRRRYRHLMSISSRAR